MVRGRLESRRGRRTLDVWGRRVLGLGLVLRMRMLLLLLLLRGMRSLGCRYLRRGPRAAVGRHAREVPRRHRPERRDVPVRGRAALVEVLGAGRVRGCRRRVRNGGREEGPAPRVALLVRDVLDGGLVVVGRCGPLRRRCGTAEGGADAVIALDRAHVRILRVEHGRLARRGSRRRGAIVVGRRVRQIGVLAGPDGLCDAQGVELGELDLGGYFRVQRRPDLEELQEGGGRLKGISRLPGRMG